MPDFIFDPAGAFSERLKKFVWAAIEFANNNWEKAIDHCGHRIVIRFSDDVIHRWGLLREEEQRIAREFLCRKAEEKSWRDAELIFNGVHLVGMAFYL